MRHNRKRLITILLLTCSFPIYAVIPPQQVTWNQDGITPTEAQLLIYKLYLSEESGKQSIFTLINTLCGTVNGKTQCSTALPIAANPAIVSNNSSQLTATDPNTKIESLLSQPFIGNQGCIFRDNLYPITGRTTGQANKNQINALRNEFKNAKFKEISITQKGNQFTLLEECVGYIVQN